MASETHGAIPAATPGNAGQASLADRLGTIALPPPLPGAACARRRADGSRIHDPDLWFPTTNAYSYPRAVCKHCPVTAACLQRALDAETGNTAWARFGMYGGLTPDERAAIAKGAVA